MDMPNPRLNALRLGLRLLAAAANTWSGLNRECWQKARWQPLDPYGLPEWWPFVGVFRGRGVSAHEAALLRLAVQEDHSPTFQRGHYRSERADNSRPAASELG